MKPHAFSGTVSTEAAPRGRESLPASIVGEVRVVARKRLPSPWSLPLRGDDRKENATFTSPFLYGLVRSLRRSADAYFSY